MTLSTCTVSFTTNQASKSATVVFQPLPGQVLSDVWLDMTPINASVNGLTGYQAVLAQGGRYRVISNRFYFGPDPEITVPAAATADLEDLIEGLGTG